MNMQNIQSMNYGVLIYNKLKELTCLKKNILFYFSNISKILDFLKYIFVLLVCCVLSIVVFNALIGFVDVFCIYE